MILQRPINPAYVIPTFAMVVVLAFQVPSRGDGESNSAADIDRYALLVGCTRYPNNPDIPELWGPANDVPAFASLLKERFGFADKNIQRLVGWPDDLESRPTYANIKAAFENLVTAAGPNTQIVILMTGHGTQAPIPAEQQNALDPSNPEHDGMDEIFLPADFTTLADTNHDNVIVDDQMGLWLDQMTKRGANVWIVFDCCHSGTMTRGVEIVERQRGINPQKIGVSDSALRAVAKKLESSGERSRGSVKAEIDTLDFSSEQTGSGGLTAFYAAQAYESAPELPRPQDAARTRENYFGLLTYVLIQTLEATDQSMTYRDVGRRVVGRYRSERGSKSPTPFFSGDLDREVLGLSTFPERSSIVLERSDRTTRLTAGELMGLTPGTILAVFPADDRTRDDSAILGYVRVKSVTPDSSNVESCDFGGMPEVPLADFPEFAKCKVAFQELGDMRLKLCLAHSGTPETKALVPALSAAIDALADEISTLIVLVDDESEAEWVLRAVDPEYANTHYGLRIDRTMALLLRANIEDHKTSDIDRSNINPLRVILGEYPVDDSNTLAKRVQRDLQKLFSWKNTWRIAEMASAEKLRGDNGKLKLEITRVDDAGTAEPADTVLAPGDNLRVQVINSGTADMWVTLLYLDADFGISVWFSEALKAGKSFTDGGTIDGSSSGPEGFVVLAVPLRGQKSQPAYEFLEQSGLGVTTRDIKSVPTRSLNPFEQLMSVAAFGKGKQRGLRRSESSTPQILSCSWVTLPATEDE